MTVLRKTWILTIDGKRYQVWINKYEEITRVKDCERKVITDSVPSEKIWDALNMWHESRRSTLICGHKPYQGAEPHAPAVKGELVNCPKCRRAVHMDAFYGTDAKGLPVMEWHVDGNRECAGSYTSSKA